MQYELDHLKDQNYVTVKVTCLQGLSLDTAIRFTGEYTDLGARLNTKKCLIDMQGITSTSGVIGKYQFAYIEARKAGLTPDWKIALLKDADDETPDFIETVMNNAGYRFKVFTEKSDAVQWLD